MNSSFFPPAPDGAPRLRLDVWEKGNISIVQLEEKLRGAARQALADAILELQLLPAPLCSEDMAPGKGAQLCSSVATEGTRGH